MTDFLQEWRNTPLKSNWSGWFQRKTQKNWPESFLTNCQTTQLREKLSRYQVAAEELGTQVYVREEACDCNGKKLEGYSAIHIQDVRSKKELWKLVQPVKLKDIELSPIESFRTKIEFPTKANVKIPEINLCQCTTVALMRNGCRCGGK